MDESTAELVLKHADAADRELNNALLAIQGRCSAEEFVALRRLIGVVTTGIFVEIMRPLYKQYRHLAPEAINAALGPKGPKR